MKTFGNIILVLIITGIGAVITCGGNLSLQAKLCDIMSCGYKSGTNQYTDLLFALWYLEIIIIFIFSIRFLFFNKKDTITPKIDDRL